MRSADFIGLIALFRGGQTHFAPGAAFGLLQRGTNAAPGGIDFLPAKIVPKNPSFLEFLMLASYSQETI